MNFTLVTTIATIAVSDAADGVDDEALLPARGRSRSQCRIMPAWLIVKSMNTPTA